jgi:hypothetical protein
MMCFAARSFLSFLPSFVGRNHLVLLSGVALCIEGPKLAGGEYRSRCYAKPGAALVVLRVMCTVVSSSVYQVTSPG